MSAITLRHGTYDDFSLLVQWAVDEFEWELSTSDYLNYNSFLPSGWFWAAENERKETVGFICAVEHGPNDGYIGLFFVRKDQRGNGIGKPLLENALKILEGRNITLVAEPHVMDIYAKKNFTILPDYALVTAEGYTTQAILDKNYNVDGVVLEEPSDQSIDHVIRYDSTISGRNRSPWCTQHLLKNPYAKSLVAFKTDGKTVCGYGTIKDIGIGKLKIGPLYGDTVEIAKMITFGLIRKFTSDATKYMLCMFCMLPDKEARRNAIAEELGLAMPYPMSHMFTQRVANVDKNRIFCLADCDVNLV